MGCAVEGFPGRPLAAGIVLALAVARYAPCAGADRYVTPDGAGSRDGSCWEDAAKGDADGMKVSLAALGPGDTLHVGGGNYPHGVNLVLSAGGASHERPVSVRGEDRGVAGFPRPVFTGDWRRTAPARGGTFLTLRPGVSYVTVENLVVNDYNGVLHANGPNRGLRIRKIDTTNCRDAYVLDGGEADGRPDSGSCDFEMSDCRIVNHTKKGVRTMNGFHDAKFIRVSTDAGGAAFANVEPRDIFSCGFHVLGSYGRKGPEKVDHHIAFIDCSADNNYYDPSPKGYWNADGFCAEGASADISFVRCTAKGNTDGGWDVKTRRPLFVDCRGSGNKRNFRVWTKAGEPVRFQGCVSENSWNVGASGHDVGYWMRGGGEVAFENCTAKGDRRCFAVEKGESTSLKFSCCRAEPAAGGAVFGRLDGEVKIETDGSVVR